MGDLIRLPLPRRPMFTARQAEVLRVLLAAGGAVLMADLPAALGVGSPPTVCMVNRLAHLGLVERRVLRVDGDARPRKLICLTRAGFDRARKHRGASRGELTLAQVAKILGCSQQNVYLIERRGLAKLERRLRRLGFVDGDREASR